MDHDEIASIVSAMKRQEDGKAYRLTADYFLGRPVPPSHHDGEDHAPSSPRCVATEKKKSGKSKSKPTDAACRSKMVEWCYQVVDFCDLSRETVSIAMSHLDRFLALAAAATTDDERRHQHTVAVECLLNRSTYQLAAMTALYLAVKLNESEVMDPKIIASLSRGTCTEGEVTDMEITMLGALRWHVQPPTSAAFVRYFLALLPTAVVQQSVRRSLLGVALFQTELAVSDYCMVGYARPSLIAYAAVSNAIASVNSVAFSSSERLSYLRDLRRHHSCGRK